MAQYTIDALSSNGLKEMFDGWLAAFPRTNYAYYSIKTKAASQPSNIVLKPWLLRALTAYCSISNPDGLHSTLPGLRIEGLGQSLQSLKPWTAGLELGALGFGVRAQGSCLRCILVLVCIS